MSGIKEVTSGFKIRSASVEAGSPEPASLLGRFFLPVLDFLRSVKIRRRERFMRLCETLPLGEKRFLAIVQIEQQRFLIATTNQSISLLYCLEGSSLAHPRSPTCPNDNCQDGIR